MQSNNSANFSFLRTGGIAAIGMAMCYLAMAITFFGLLSVPTGADTLERIRYFQQEYVLVTTGYAFGYLLFGLLLAILLQALKYVLPDDQSALAGLADRFGGVWVVLMMATGMTVLIGLDKMISLVDSEPVQALALYHSNSMIAGGLGGGIELVAGLWMWLFSIAALRQQLFSKALHILGLLVGTLGILSLLHTVPYLKDVFGLLQLLWFIWLGVALWRVKPKTPYAPSA